MVIYSSASQLMASFALWLEEIVFKNNLKGNLRRSLQRHACPLLQTSILRKTFFVLVVSEVQDFPMLQSILPVKRF